MSTRVQRTRTRRGWKEKGGGDEREKERSPHHFFLRSADEAKGREKRKGRKMEEGRRKLSHSDAHALRGHWRNLLTSVFSLVRKAIWTRGPSRLLGGPRCAHLLLSTAKKKRATGKKRTMPRSSGIPRGPRRRRCPRRRRRCRPRPPLPPRVPRFRPSTTALCTTSCASSRTPRRSRRWELRAGACANWSTTLCPTGSSGRLEVFFRWCQAPPPSSATTFKEELEFFD